MSCCSDFMERCDTCQGLSESGVCKLHVVLVSGGRLPNSLAHMCSSMASVFISLSHGGQMGE